MDKQLYELLHQCTLRVAGQETIGHGTGFFVAPGLILTCAHVVKDHLLCGIEVFWNGQSYSAQLTRSDSNLDLALLNTDLKEHPCVWLNEGATAFDSLYSYGYPDDYRTGAPVTFTLEGKAGEQEEQLKFKSGQVRPGLSGAPLLNTRTGGVCGVVRETRDRASDLGGSAIPTAILLRAFPELIILQKQFHQRDQRWLSHLPSGRDEKTQVVRFIIDQSDYVQDRLQRFVGRQAELTMLRERIEEKREGGGYVILTGDAGQGKSSIIVRMIADQDIDTSAYHFIQPGSGFDAPISLLRNLMARLILKYDLPEDYDIKGESYQIMAGNFLRVLKAIAENGAREIVYIDGLEQLKTDSSAVPDVSFLPSRVPPGIVLVVGIRPNKTLDDLLPLTGLKSDDPYPLPGLSREDFDLLLQHRKAPGRETLSDSLYQRLTNNPLYLDLVAQELGASPDLRLEQLIARIESNPNDIFTITFSRMQRSRDEWYDVIRPILGVLLVAQEPLSAQQIGHIFKQESVRFREGISQLGGLLTRASKQTFTLFHPKLKEYLKQEADAPGNGIQFNAEEVETLHGQVTNWCKQGPIEQLWSELPNPSPRDDYQEYAQKHYIFHLYEARRYEHLFEVLNKGSYEQEKLRFDKSTRSSAADLMLGCQAAACGAGRLEEGEKLLGYLWRYTLLRTNLTTRADAYPIEAFQALLALDREREALDLAELLTQPARKLAVLILFTEYLLKHPTRKTEGLQFYSRVYEIALSIKDDNIQTSALRELTTVLINAGQLIRAESVAHSITRNKERIRALSHLAAKLKLGGEEEKAETLWQEASTIADAIADSDERNRATYYLSISFMQAKEWKRAEAAVRSIDTNDAQIRALCQLALSFKIEGLASQAETVWEQAQALVSTITKREERDKAYRIYAIAQAEAGLWDEAKTTANRYLANNPTEKVAVFGKLASSLVRAGLWEQSRSIINLIVKEYGLTDVDAPILDNILTCLSTELARRDRWEQAEETASAIPRKEAQCRALMGIVSELARAGMSQKAQTILEKARIMGIDQTDTVQASVAAILVAVLVEVGQIAEAEKIILPDKQAQENIREALGVALAEAGQIAEAEQVASETTYLTQKDTIQRSIAIAQIKAGQTEQAITIARSILHLERQSQALIDLVTICCQKHQWDLAQKIARQIQSEPLRAEAQRRIVVALVHNGQLKTAQDLVPTIDNEYYKADAWCDLATSLARSGKDKEAKKLVVRNITKNPLKRTKALCNIDIEAGSLGIMATEPIALGIEPSEERNEALRNVAIAYARAQLWDEAEKIAEEIGDEQKRDEAWQAIARELAEVGQWTRAVTALDKIQKTKQRIAGLEAWGKLLANPGGKETREQIVQHLSDSKEKASLLVSTAHTLAQANRYLEQIHVTQQAWLQASTKDDCQHLFAVVQDLLLYNPEMCADFYGSFEWVNSFLNN